MTQRFDLCVFAQTHPAFMPLKATGMSDWRRQVFFSLLLFCLFFILWVMWTWCVAVHLKRAGRHGWQEKPVDSSQIKLLCYFLLLFLPPRRPTRSDTRSVIVFCEHLGTLKGVSGQGKSGNMSLFFLSLNHFFNLVLWCYGFENLSLKDRNSLNQTVKWSSELIGEAQTLTADDQLDFKRRLPLSAHVVNSSFFLLDGGWFIVPICRTKQYKNSFVPAAIPTA